MRRLAALACLLGACSTEGHFREPELTVSRMMEQPRADAYEHSPFFADGATMRTPPEGTVARGSLPEPRPETNMALVSRGRHDFDVHCAPCHGVTGNGDTVVSARMELVKPGSLHTAAVAEMSDEELYSVLSEGKGLMAALDVELSPRALGGHRLCAGARA